MDTRRGGRGWGTAAGIPGTHVLRVVATDLPQIFRDDALHLDFLLLSHTGSLFSQALFKNKTRTLARPRTNGRAKGSL